MSTATIPRFTVHDRLRKAREVAGLDQAQLAERIGMSRNSVSNYEAGHTRTGNLKPIYLKGWALACGVDLDWLRFGDGSDRSVTPGYGGAILAYKATPLPFRPAPARTDLLTAA